MDLIPKHASKKFAFTGTNCSGKTTMAMETTARLKAQYHCLAELVSSQDRKVTWSDAHFPYALDAHYGMMSTLITAEVQASLRGDADVIITDRSVLDLYSIASFDHPQGHLLKGLRALMESWIETYTTIYYLSPFPYQADGKRPDDEFRQSTHENLLRLIEAYKFPNVVMGLTRDEVSKDIRRQLGYGEVKQVFAMDDKCQAVCDAIGFPFFVKEQKSPVTSDLDCWFFVAPENTDQYDAFKAHNVAHLYFGEQVDLHIMVAPLTAEDKTSRLGMGRMYIPNKPQ